MAGLVLCTLLCFVIFLLGFTKYMDAYYMICSSLGIYPCDDMFLETTLISLFNKERIFF